MDGLEGDAEGVLKSIGSQVGGTLIPPTLSQETDPSFETPLNSSVFLDGLRESVYSLVLQFAK